MWALWATAAYAQGSFTLAPASQLIEGSTRIVVNGSTVGEVWTGTNDSGKWSEVWASQLSPASMTGGFTLIHATEAIDYDDWLDALLEDEDPNNLYDNWLDMCFEYTSNFAPLAPNEEIDSDSYTTRTFTVHTREGDAGIGLGTGGTPTIRGYLQRETHVVDGVTSEYRDFWVLFESPNPEYVPPDEANDSMWTLPKQAQQSTIAFFTTHGGDPVKKFAEIVYHRQTSSTLIDPDDCFSQAVQFDPPLTR